MSDNSNTGVPEDEKETHDLLALLYPDDGAEDLDSEFISDEELGGMQSLRSLFKDLPDEEPSDAVTNKLMALAAQHAPVPAKESKGVFAWFSDLFMPIALHPGMAAAATLVLVVGVAGTLYVKGEAKMAQPDVESRAEAPADTAAEEPASATAPEERDFGAVTAPGDVGAEAADGTLQLDDLDERNEPSEDPAVIAPKAEGRVGNSSAIGGLLNEKAADADKSDFKPAPKKTNRAGAIGASATGSAYENAQGADGDSSAGRRVKDIVEAPSSPPSSSPRSSSPRSSSPRSSSPSSNAPLNDAPADAEPAREQERTKRGSAKPKPVVTTKPSSTPPPPPRVVPASRDEQEESDDDEDAPSSQRKADKKKEVPSESVKLHNQAIAAAKSGNCQRVLSLGAQIRKLDSSYYDRTFLSDSRLTACRQSKK
tara:strand:- start:9110 stop:10387 length:1278 start_codon:yes stop_codon:yes gene_type:complete